MACLFPDDAWVRMLHPTGINNFLSSLEDTPMPTMLILGATSDIARATALAFGMKGWDLIQAGREQAALSRYANEIATRTGRQVSVDHFDAMQPESHGAFWQQVADRVDGVFCAGGL